MIIFGEWRLRNACISLYVFGDVNAIVFTSHETTIYTGVKCIYFSFADLKPSAIGGDWRRLVMNCKLPFGKEQGMTTNKLE